jgi:hypothetical protein
MARREGVWKDVTRHLATALNALAFLWVSAATIYLLVTAGYEGLSPASALAGNTPIVGHIDTSLASANGPWVVGLLLIVSLIAGLPFGVALTSPKSHRAVTWTAGLLLLGFSIISGYTVGLMYLPGAVLLLAAATTNVVVRGHHGDWPPTKESLLTREG